MKLQEILKSLNLSEDNIKAINGAVDAVIESKVSVKDEEIKKLNGDIETLNGELKPFKEEKRSSHIKSLVGGFTSEDKLKGALALSGISEEDDDDTIKSKVKKTLEEYKYLQHDAGIPDEVVETKKPTQQKESSSDKFDDL